MPSSLLRSPSQSPWLSLLRLCAHTLSEAISPSRCAACDQPLLSRSAFCTACAHTLLRPNKAISRHFGIDIAAFGQFGGALATALRRFKYENRPDLSAPLGQLLRRTAREAGFCADAVLPVPLHARRLSERGYNQAALLARPVAKELSAPLHTRALVRLRATDQQAGQGRQDRLNNVQKAFALQRPIQAGQALQNLRLLLVDDVFTTGATLEACVDALRSAGATSISALVLARA